MYGGPDVPAVPISPRPSPPGSPSRSCTLGATPARFFIEGVSSKFFPAYYAVLMKNAPAEDLYTAVEYIQSLLPAEGKFAVGEYSMADIVVTAFVPRGRMLFANDISVWEAGEGLNI
ncbi:hypothetical protein LXA43DRAFT_1096359 [Ganoderma leucocontextum]|nr:hypothetical protein LXA43DRAFT_1096359 [Ganoderma leucocontextum]